MKTTNDATMLVKPKCKCKHEQNDRSMGWPQALVLICIFIIFGFMAWVGLGD